MDKIIRELFEKGARLLGAMSSLNTLSEKLNITEWELIHEKIDNLRKGYQEEFNKITLEIEKLLGE